MTFKPIIELLICILLKYFKTKLLFNYLLLYTYYV